MNHHARTHARSTHARTIPCDCNSSHNHCLVHVLFCGQSSAIGGGSGKSVSELERVVAAMRKVVERLQSENAGLRRRAARLQPARQKGDVAVERGVAVMGGVNGDDKEEKVRAVIVIR